MKCKLKYIIPLLIIIITLIVILSLNRHNSVNSVVSIRSHGNVTINEGYGIVYKKSDKTYIVTNYHVIKNSKKIIINDGRKNIKASILNSDEYEDIAILTVNNNINLKVAKFSSISDNEVKTIKDNDKTKYINGKIVSKDEDVLVTLSTGNYIIKAIKLDINIKPGNSGGPLYNSNNNIIGMVSMKEDKGNIGYALDINHVLKMCKKLEHGNIKKINLGIEVASSSNKDYLKQYNLEDTNADGIVVTKIYDNSLFNNDELQVGDVITKINNYKVVDMVHFKYYVYNSTKSIKLTVSHNGEEKEIVLNF